MATLPHTLKHNLQTNQCHVFIISFSLKKKINHTRELQFLMMALEGGKLSRSVKDYKTSVA